MYAIALYGVLVGLTAPVGHTAVVDSNVDTASSITVLVDSAGHGKGTGQETGKSGQGNRGKESQFGADQPRSGDFSPNPSDATRRQSPPKDQTAGSDQPAGIGEEGSGQTRSTTERSGGQQPSASESMAQSSTEHGEGKTEQAAKDLQSQNK